MKKLKGLLGLAVSLMLIGVTGVSALEYNVEEDNTAIADLGIDYTQDIVINGNGHTLTGMFNQITNDINIEISNVTINVDSKPGTEDIAIDIRSNGATLALDNVTILNYTKAGVYAEQFKSIVINNSTFDGSETDEIGEGSGDEADLVKRSAAGIDINIGNSATTDYAIEKIEITNSTFRNVIETEGNTTGGGIKVKIKNKEHLTSMCDVVIENNTFEGNVRDLVVGTDSPKTGTTTEQADTGNITFKLLGNTAMKVVNNSSSEELEENRTEIIEASDYLVELNYYDDTHNVFTEDETGLVVDPTAEDFDLNEELTNVTVEDLVIDYGDYTITINKADVKEDLTNTLTDLSLVVSEDTETEGLIEYITEDNTFIKTTASGDLPANVVTLSLNLSKYANQNVNLYYFNPDSDELEFVSVVAFDENGNANIALEHYSEYVLSTTDLLDSTTGGEIETPVEDPTVDDTPGDVVENPSTNDNVGIFMFLGALSVIGLTVATIVLKKKHN